MIDMWSVTRHYLRIVLTVIFYVAFSVTCACVFIPFQPRLPDSSLDSSWMMAMNAAIANHIAIGKDVFFTFGPYSFIYSLQYSSATDMLMLLGSAWLALCFILVASFIYERFWLFGIILIYIMASFMFTRDALINSFSLFYILMVVETGREDIGRRSRFRAAMNVVSIALGASGLGLIVTIKVSFIPLAIATWLAAIGLTVRRRRWRLASAVIVAAPTTTLLAWLVAGQPLSAIPDYFIHSVPISAGYTEAMSSPGPLADIVVYIVAAMMCAGCGFAVNRSRRLDGLVLSAILTLFLFISFKGAFVREDGHVLAAATAIIVAALVLLALERSAVTAIAAVAAMVALAVIDIGFMQSWQELLVNNTERTYNNAIDGLSLRRRGEIPAMYAKRLDAIRQESPLPTLNGTSDLYFHSLAYLLVSGNRWNPRPVFQSYSAYNSFLIKLNAAHLEEKKAPDNIFLKTEAIDSRFLSMDDGLSWFDLLQRYEPSRIVADTLILTKKPSDRVRVLTRSKLQTVHATLNETVNLPDFDGLVAATFRFHRNIIGKIVSISFKPPALTLVTTLSDGSTRTNRIIPNMTSTDFLLSPDVETVNDFAMLYGDTFKLDSKKVVSFVVRQDDRIGGVDPEFDATFSAVPLPVAETDVAVYDTPVTLPADAKYTTSSHTCVGSIDAVNGVHPPNRSNVDGPLTVDGWAAIDPSRGRLPDAVLIELKGEDGKTTMFSTHPQQRDDLSTFFKRGDMAHAGYAAFVNSSNFHGPYVLTVALRMGEQVVECSNLSTLVDVR